MWREKLGFWSGIWGCCDQSEGFEEAVNFGRAWAGGKGFGALGRDIVGAKGFEQALAAGFELWWERKPGGGGKQFDAFLQGSQMAKAVHLGGEQCRAVLPALTAVKRQRALARADAVIGNAAGKASVGQLVVDGAGMLVEMRAGGAGGFVDGKGVALVKRQRDAAKRGAGGAIGGQVGQGDAQPTTSSKALRKRAESSSSLAWVPPMRTVSPPNLPTVRIGTPACPAASISASA